MQESKEKINKICHATAITASVEEMKKWIEARNAGEEYEFEGRIEDVPEGFRRWCSENEDKIHQARMRGKEPYFLKENKEWVDKVLNGEDKISQKLDKINDLKNESGNTYVSFEPFSPIIMNYLEKRKKGKERTALFEEILEDKSFKKSEESPLTLIHPRHKKKGNWEETVEMAKHINKKGDVVAFLPEYEDKVSADAITKINGKYKIVDFKYCISTNWNTIRTELEKVFSQAEGVVIQLKNADMGQFRDAIDYMQRNNLRIKDIKVMNEYGKIIDLDYKLLRSGDYIKKIRGLL